MVKAVNKLVMEINNTGNDYFEKAVFYIRPEMAQSTKLDNGAKAYINEVVKGFTTEREKPHTLLIGILSALMGAGAMGIICALVR